MKIKKTNKNTVTIHKTLVRDKRLSLQAKGLALFLVALPDDFDVTYTSLSNYNSNGTDSIKTSFIELRTCGYLNGEGDYVILNSNPSFDDLVKKVLLDKAKEVASKKPDEWYIEKRKEERAEFLKKVRAAINDMRPPQPTTEQFKDFVDYWAGLDDIDPSKSLRYKTEKTFQIAGRLRTFMRIVKQTNRNNNDGL